MIAASDVALTVGTAGHVDHGKTWLVRALTGKDTDRLPEEQARGISIDLGYAPLELPDGTRLSLVDVPGHERFVRTMVAGATGIDLFLLVIDAAEGARPQTHEHLAILRLLGVEHGVVAVTKADAVDAETLELALEEARELVPGRAGRRGQREDRRGARRAARRARARSRPASTPRARGLARRGSTSTASSRCAGSARSSTGTLWSGSIARGRRAAASSRRAATCACAACRCTTARSSAPRRASGSPSACPGVERQRPPPRRRARRAGRLPALATGSTSRSRSSSRSPTARGSPCTTARAAIPARVVRVGDAHAQLRLAAPVVAARGDRVVLRDETTVGGGVVLDPAPPRRVDAERDRLLGEGDPASIVRALVHAPVRGRRQLAARALLDGAELEEGLDAVRVVDGWAFSDAWLEETRRAVEERLRERAEASPLDPGLAAGRAAPGRAVGGERARPAAGRAARAEGVPARARLRRSATRAEAAARARGELAAAGLAATKVDDAELARFLEAEGRLVRLGDGFAVAAGRLRGRARPRRDASAAAAGEITLARFRDLAGVGRRDAQLLLERIDADGLTRRVGDRRVLRRAARAGALRPE